MPFLKLDCPGIALNVRTQPSFESEAIGTITSGTIVEVQTETFNGFYALADGSAYVIMGDNEEIFYHEVARPRRSRGSITIPQELIDDFEEVKAALNDNSNELPPPPPVPASEPDPAPHHNVIDSSTAPAQELAAVTEPAAVPEPVELEPVTVSEPVATPEPVVLEPVTVSETVATPEPVVLEPVAAPEPVAVPEPVVPEPVAAPEPVAVPEPVATPESAPIITPVHVVANISRVRIESPEPASSPIASSYRACDDDSNPLNQFIDFDFSEMDYSDRTK